MAHRNTHYWLWFLLFGVIPFIIAALNHFPADVTSYTAYWLLGTGVLGLLLSNKNLNEGKLARPYDVIVGLIFAISGIVGILGMFHVGVAPVSTIIGDIGLNLGGVYPLIFAFLGFKSLHHAMDK